MASHTTIPIESATSYPQPQYNQPVKHRHSHYYARRVRESLTTRFSKLLCSIFLSLLLVVGIIMFILWLSLRPHRPRFHVHAFSIPGLNQQNGFENALISFSVTARNANQKIGIYYDVMHANVYYQDQGIGSTPLVSSPFYQHPKNTTPIYGELSGATLTVSSNKWQAFVDEISKGTAGFRLDLKSRIRFEVKTWDTKSHRMTASCDVRVGSDGQILPTFKDKRCPVYFT